jgi:hypothetical protein
VTSFADQVNNGPMIFAALEMLKIQLSQLPSPEIATQQVRQDGSIPFPLRCIGIR